MKDMIDLKTLMELVSCNVDSAKKSDAEILEVLNENGESVGTAPRFLCHRLGLIHQVVFLIIEDYDGKMLLQTRGDFNKRRYDLPVGGHMNIDDNSPIDALCREMREEIGLEVHQDELSLICSYMRKVKEDLKKPKEMNCELRYVYLYKVNKNQSNSILSHFKDRFEKEMVLEINWFPLEDIIKNCDLSNAADGLCATIPHYLIWKLQNR
ncbi:hypothetical protein C818_00995 [Lachnospiraceae bacterium MD308]|nr:hypothetical protein C818_00995 [Lachnospiraceae bacterium MD308]